MDKSLGNITEKELKLIRSVLKTSREFFIVVKDDQLLINIDFIEYLIIDDCGISDGIYELKYNKLVLTKEKLSDYLYPIFNEKFKRINVFNTKELKLLLLKSFKFVDNNDLYPMRTGVLFDFEEDKEITIVATDAYSIFINNFIDKNKNRRDFVFRKTKIAIDVIKSFDYNENTYLDYSTNKDNVEFIKLINGRVLFISKALNDEYSSFPNYKSVLPENYKNNFSFFKSDILRYLPKTKKELNKTSISFYNIKGNKIDVEIRMLDYNNTDIVIERLKIDIKKTNDYSNNEIILLMPIFHKDFTISFNAGYFKKITKNIDTDWIDLHFNEPEQATIFSEHKEKTKIPVVKKQSQIPDYKAAIEAMEVMFETTGEQKYNDAIEALKLML